MCPRRPGTRRQAEQRDRACEPGAAQIAYPPLTVNRLPHARQIPFVLLCLAGLLLAGLVPAGSALADGDPASDVLATQALFLPWDANLPTAEQAQLMGVLESAAHHGFPIRVAVIASAADLGSVTALWHQPQAYASFLGEELSLVYMGPLLVVMPNGFGLRGFAPPSAQLDAALSGISAPTDGAQLGQVTIAAIGRLAAASGHPLPSTSVSIRLAPGASGGSTAAIDWVVFALGAVAIFAAWTASLRAQPLRARGA